MKLAKKKKLPYVAIFEDDILFNKDFDANLEQALNNAPSGWHILYLGVSGAAKYHYVDDVFRRPIGMWGAFAYIVHQRAYNNLILLLNKGTKIVDAYYIDYQKTYFCLKPHASMVLHPPGYSTIKEKEVNYQHLQ